MNTRSFLRLILAALTGLALVAPLTATAAAHRHHPTPAFPDRIELPDGFQPEGIAIGPGPDRLLRLPGRRRHLRRRPAHRQGRGDQPGARHPVRRAEVRPARPALRGRRSGRHRPGGDVRTGAILASYQFTAGPSFVNDVVLTKRMAWFTDSRQRAELYGVPLARHGVPGTGGGDRPAAAERRVGADPGVINANGIAQTPDRSALLVVKSDTGQLFRVNPRTGVARVVDLGGYALTNGDGLLVEGRTLYVVQNQLNQVAVLKLNRSGTRGALLRTLTDPGFAVPTTVASFGRSLYLPNARFGITDPQTAQYWVTRIDKR